MGSLGMGCRWELGFGGRDVARVGVKVGSGMGAECCGSRVECRWSGEERGMVWHWSVVGVGWKWNEVAVEWNGSRTGSGVMG